MGGFEVFNATKIYIAVLWVRTPSTQELTYTQNMEKGYSSERLVTSQGIISTLKTEAVCSSETLVYIRI
jgi:hypothetical protein